MTTRQSFVIFLPVIIVKLSGSGTWPCQRLNRRPEIWVMEDESAERVPRSWWRAIRKLNARNNFSEKTHRSVQKTHRVLPSFLNLTGTFCCARYISWSCHHALRTAATIVCESRTAQFRRAFRNPFPSGRTFVTVQLNPFLLHLSRSHLVIDKVLFVAYSQLRNFRMKMRPMAPRKYSSERHGPGQSSWLDYLGTRRTTYTGNCQIYPSLSSEMTGKEFLDF